MEFDLKRASLRILSEHSPALAQRRLTEIAPVFAALGRGALAVGKRIGAGAANAVGSVAAGAGTAGIGLAKGLGKGIKNAASTLTKPDDSTEAP